jgi:hypothetical protein
MNARAVERVFNVSVSRKGSTWVATCGGERFVNGDEQSLQERVRRHFADKVAAETGVESLTARVNKCSWRVLVTDQPEDQPTSQPTDQPSRPAKQPASSELRSHPTDEEAS